MSLHTTAPHNRDKWDTRKAIPWGVDVLLSYTLLRGIYRSVEDALRDHKVSQEWNRSWMLTPEGTRRERGAV